MADGFWSNVIIVKGYVRNQETTWHVVLVLQNGERVLEDYVEVISSQNAVPQKQTLFKPQFDRRKGFDYGTSITVSAGF